MSLPMPGSSDSENVVVPIPNNLRLIKANQVPETWGLNMVLFGVPGCGKTTLAASAQDSPHGRNVLFIDVEGGTRSIADRANIDVIRPESIADVQELYHWLIDMSDVGQEPYKTIVIDTISELQRLGMKDILQKSRDPNFPGIQEWAKSNEQISALVRAFRNLAQLKGWNVIFTAHANEQKDEVTGAILIRPNLTPKAAELVCGAVDVVGYMTRDYDGKHHLRLEPSNTIVAKYRQPLTGPVLPTMIENPNLVDILAHMRSEVDLAGDSEI
jgi:phage nucleotide-binding protein